MDDFSLVGRQESGDVGVEVQQDQLVGSNQAGNLKNYKTLK
jgi:hypothetical protein